MPRGIYTRTKKRGGWKLSEETRSKISKAHKGKPAPNRNYWLGKKRPPYSIETRTKISKTMKAKKEQLHLWKGGVYPINLAIRKSLEYKLWRESVYKRDNWTCVWCGDKTSGNLEADHIKPFAYFPELRFAIDNGRTLCKSCHRKTDTYGDKYRYLINSYKVK